MSASLSSAAAPASDALPLARDWFMAHYEELRSRASACFARRRPDQREEAVAEVLALVYLAATRAARRGTLKRVTAYWAVLFAARQVRAGRRCTGTSSNRCVQSERTQRLGRSTVLSLEVLQATPRPQRREFALIDRDAEDPSEVVRRRMDYPAVLAQVSAGAQATFRFLAASHAQGRLADLAAELGVSAGRVTQLKGELRDAFAARDYEGPLGPRPAPRAHSVR